MKPLFLILTLLLAINTWAQEHNNSEKNPFLSDSNWPIGHTNTGQTNAVETKGPEGRTRQLREDEIQYHDLGQFQLGQVISGQYENGRRAIWCNGSNFVAKLDYDTYNIISLLRISNTVDHSGKHELFLDKMDSDIKLKEKVGYALKNGFVGDMSSVYIMMNSHNQFVGAVPRGIRVYGDVEEGNIDSGIKIIGEYTLPDNIKGEVTGMNMSYDGKMIIITSEGFLVAINDQLELVSSILLQGKEEFDRSKKVTFVRNSIAIDKDGGIYAVSINHMHKVVWDGKRLSQSTEDGAWIAEYPNNFGLGSGSTPALMGFGEGKDQFVVITDGDKVMNMTLFWRNEIPEDWKGIKGLDDRIAGSKAVTFGYEDAKYVQQEQGVTIHNYGMIVVNNIPENVPIGIEQEAKKDPRVMWAFMGYMNGQTEFAPLGVEKMIWNTKTRTLETAWVNSEVSDPTCVPFVSLDNNMFYTIGSRDNKFTFEAIDANTGESVFHYKIGGARYNGFYSAPTIDEEGRILYGSTWGVVRITPKPKTIIPTKTAKR